MKYLMKCSKGELARRFLQWGLGITGGMLLLWLPIPVQQVLIAGDISDAAYSRIIQWTVANQASFYVYQNADSGFNHGIPSGFFGSVDKIQLNAACIDDPGAANGCSTDTNRLDRVRGTALRISFAPIPPGNFAGVSIEEPENFGAQPRGNGYDLRGANQVVFDVRSPGGIKVQFGVGGCTTNFITIPAGQTYKQMSIPLNSLGCQPDLTKVQLLFTVVTNDINAPNGGTVLLDNIRFEPVPTSRQTALGFPPSSQTFGVAPLQTPASGRVSFPSDQGLQNLSTSYESALAIVALLDRATNQDLGYARLIANAFHYALSHDNRGSRLPTAPDGSAGLHNGYASGDLALFNDQGAGGGRASDIRLAGFNCGASGFCLLLDGATGGNNAFAVLALAAAYRRSGDSRYFDAARTIGRWIVGNLADTASTDHGGYYLGYRDGTNPKEIIKSKSTENAAAIFAAFTLLAAIERQLGNDNQASEWTIRANAAGDFVMDMFDSSAGCFQAGTVPMGTPFGPGIKPDGARKGNDVINTFDFLDANAFPILALASTPRYRDQIDWRRPAQCILNKFAQSVTANGITFKGFSIVTKPTAGPDGIAWEFTGKAIATMRFVDRLYQESRFKESADLYLSQVRQAQTMAPFADGQGVVASTLQNGDRLPPIEQCLSTPFQCIPERVGLAATTWAIFAEQGINPLNGATLGAGTAASVSAANFRGSELASEAITAAFGSNLAIATQAASTTPLPTSLAGTQIWVTDSANVERMAPLFFVSPLQVNYQMPAGTANGLATVTITSSNGAASTGFSQISSIAPGLFAANADGQGVPAAVAVRVKPDGAQIFEPVAQFNMAQNKFVSLPIDLGPPNETVVIVLFGTGIRNRSMQTAVNANLGGVDAPVLYASVAPGFAGLDQVNGVIPRSLAGRGEIDLILTVDGKTANAVRVNIK